MQTTPHMEQTNGPGTEIERRFGQLDDRLSESEYNFEHFRPKHLLYDIEGTVAERGIQPGAEAPDFTLPRAGGGHLRLREQRGKPVLLHFGSPT